MENFCVRLEARDPARGCFRAYRTEAGKPRRHSRQTYPP